MRILGGLLVAIPFVFALLRAVSTGTDLRYLWVALASTIAAAVVVGLRDRSRAPSPARGVGALVAATAAAGAMGFAQGARSVPAVLIVSLGFAICGAGGLALVGRTRTG